MNSISPFQRILAISSILLFSTAALAEWAKLPKSLAGLKFQSVKQFLIGELPTGPVLGHRIISFQKDGIVTYQESDAVYFGPYVWDSKSGRLTGKLSGGLSLKARIDPKTGILLWDGVGYKLMNVKP